MVPARRLIPSPGTTRNSSQPFDSPLLNPPLNSGDAGSGGAASLAGGDARSCAQRRHHRSDRAVLAQPARPSSREPTSPASCCPPDLVAVAVDADIAITFTNPLSNDAAIATQSYPVTDDPGTQKVQDLSVRYALKSVQIQRQPAIRRRRTGRTWSSPDDTALDTGGTSMPRRRSRSPGTPTPAPTAWCQPDRLLINCRTPYSVVDRLVSERRGGARQRRRLPLLPARSGQGVPDPLARPELDGRRTRASAARQPGVQRGRRPVVVDRTARDDERCRRLHRPDRGGRPARTPTRCAVRSTSPTRQSLSPPSCCRCRPGSPAPSPPTTGSTALTAQTVTGDAAPPRSRSPAASLRRSPGSR